MAGGAIKYRHLNRDSAHRQALLRNLVTSLITHESITTTWPKAKEAQRLAEKLITLGKRNTDASRTKAQQILFTPFRHLNRLFGELRERYADRPGGYTRVLRIESQNKHHDQAPTAILELVDGPKDMRFAMTARTLVRERARTKSEDDEDNSQEGIRDVTAKNVLKVTQFRKGGQTALEREVLRLERSQAIPRKSARQQEEKSKPPSDRTKTQGQRQEQGREQEQEQEEQEADEDDPVPFARDEETRQPWERYDHYRHSQRRERRLEYRLAEMEERKERRKQVREFYQA